MNKGVFVMKIIKILLVATFLIVSVGCFAQSYRGSDYQDWRLCHYKGEIVTGYCACGKELIDRNNQKEVECVRIEPKFKQASVFYNDPYAPAMNASDKWGFINPYGEWVITPIFEKAGVVIAGRSSVTVDGKTSSINIEEYIKKGEEQRP